MLKIDVISGFLGAGKTTFIKRLLNTSLKNENVVLIENEYGEVSVDSDILTDSKIEIKELSQGCICCSLVGDFSKSLKEIIEKYNPDRILIEPSGVGKLSDVVKAIDSVGLRNHINSLVCLVDAKKAKMYDKNFGEFFIDQIENAQTVILSRMDIVKEENAQIALDIIRKHNKNCVVVTTPISKLSDEEVLKVYEGFDTNLLKDVHLEHHHEHHHDHEECCCGEHHHEHHHDHEECCCGEHHHEHHHDHEECCCGEHHHEHHHADEIFSSVGIETVKKYNRDELKKTLDDMAQGKYGQIVRSKGIVQTLEGNWIVFNLTPEEVEIEETKAIAMGKIVVIGAHIQADEIKKLF